MEKVSFGVAVGYVLSDSVTGFPSSEVALSGSVAYHVMNDADSPVSVTVQGGAGWSKPGDDPNDGTLLLFPLGVVIGGSTEAGSMMVTPWVMPRVEWTRSSPTGGTSSTDTDFGASAGVGFATEGGFGFGAALDWLLVDDGTGSNTSNLLISVGVNYVLYYTCNILFGRATG